MYRNTETFTERKKKKTDFIVALGQWFMNYKLWVVIIEAPKVKKTQFKCEN